MKRIILAAAAVIACNTAFAAEPGSYVSASIGSATQKLTIEDTNVSDDDIAAQVAAGLRLTPNFGVEVGYSSFGTAGIEGNGAELSSKPRSLHVAAIGECNLTDEFAITGKLGVASTRTKVAASVNGDTDNFKESQTGLMFAVGASYSFSPEVALIAEYHNFGKVIKDEGVNLKVSFVSVGIRYSF